jgi:hypothetical protein
MLRLQLIALAALALLTPGAGQARQAPTEPATTFKDWTVICDNLRNCEADGFATEDAEKVAILQLNRSGAPGAPAAVVILLFDETAQAIAGKSLVLAVDGRAVMTVKGEADGAATLAPAQVGPLLGAARNGSALSISLDDTELGVVSLAGMVAALRMADDQQARVGTVTALIAKGPAPLSAVPPQPAAPVVRRAPAVAQTGLPAKPSPGVKTLAAKAECEMGEGFEDPQVHRLSADKVLWMVPCGGGAYNFDMLYVVVDNKGAGARLAPGFTDGLLTNSAYDPKTRILSSYSKGRGIGDCGDSSEWAWTGEEFELTRWASMPVCRGQAAWPVSFQAKVE